jgi:RNA polymerase sigma-70 factor (ECF subfamily)
MHAEVLLTRALRKPTELRLVVGPTPPAANVEHATTSEPASEADPFDALYLRYAPYVASIGARLLGRDDELEDLVQDVFIQVLRGVGSLREPAAFKGWLAQITVRAATRRLRVRRLRKAFLGAHPAADYESLCTRAATPEQRALVAQVYALLDRLPAKTRVIWILRNVEGQSLTSIASMVECSMSTVQRSLLKAQAMIEEGIGAHELGR